MGKKIMLQGTASNVGKSIITTGLCRIFKQDNYKVIPFKSQNMALNSFITKEGLEMGRAQVSQAEACGIDPIADMNPILLKPNGNNKSQVIVRGKVIGDMSSKEYYEYKLELEKILDDIFKEFEEKFDIVVMEGAGSCAEINLMDRDISNMGMAQIADAPVILIGDIDRGGVFASIAGTMLLLPEEHKKRVKGVIINKFRGRKELLESGVKMLEDIIKVPVLGVVPYTDIKIEEEDSVTTRFKKKVDKGDIHIEVVRTPHMSNFTDFNIFETQEDVSLRYVDYGESLGNPDIVIIPGTKSTIDDLMFLRENGLENQIKELHKKGKLIIGICGGYQMLGKVLKDPYHVENELEEVEGIGLLDVETTFELEKTTTQVKALLGDNLHSYLENLNEKEVNGYEIHMGMTTRRENSDDFATVTEKLGEMVSYEVGSVNNQCNVFGTYLHGVFDDIDFTRTILNNIRKMKNLESIESKVESFDEFKNKEYDKLADFLREHLDMEKIYEIIKNGDN
ncbi:cobyric acid synthase [Terrisporobacter mayombei]|uniref:Cobyric acid synthase n=1 Tax=Terrisporobacter mayombei TaxID=1541 RepID=A0ABY9Q586_9FIRM|nr:cobyric acid synthase [Terrisporobacter mayombei]MCC3868719.1 cobyric acid synthase [Terrisporobacter mayombei]WMT83153.1 Cobyric acid synthase [Terrisporobacter mayombei]